MLSFNAEVRFGHLVLPCFSTVEITTSWRSIGDSARLSLPGLRSKLYKLATVLAPGRPVEVRMGYNGELRTEFTGYIARVKVDYPFTLELEDESYWLKRRDVPAKAWKKTTLREVLAHIYDGPLAGEVPAVELAPFRLEKMRQYKALEKLKEEFGLTIYFRGKTLYAGLAYTELAGSTPIIYDLQRNVVSSELEVATDPATQPGIKAISILRNGKKLEAEVGEKGAGQVTQHFYNITSEKALKELANIALKRLSTGGLQGRLTTFGIPYVTHGQIAVVRDPAHHQGNGVGSPREGRAFVDEVRVTVSKTGGFRRILTLGRRAA